MPHPAMLKSRYLRFAHALLFALASPLIASAAPSAISEAELIVPIGDGEFEIAGLGSESDDWKPLFFAADANAIVSIPDHFRSRILRFGMGGAPLPPIGCAAITPRLNFFGASPAGGWVAFSDSVLYRVAPDGSIAWSAPFPLMVFPERVFASGNAVSIRVAGAADSSSQAIVIDDSPPFGATLESIQTIAAEVPAIRTGADKRPFTLRDARLAFPGSWLAGDPDASLAAIGPGAASWWARREGSNIELVRYADASGRGAASSILIPTDGEGFWFVVVPKDDGTALVYANRSLSDAVAISRYRVRF